MIACRSAVSVVVRNRSRLRVRAASSSSIRADLGEAEPGVVAEVLDEPQPLDVVVVVEAVVAVAPGGRREEADLLVVADRPGRQAERRGDLLDPQQALGRSGRGGVVEVAHGPISLPDLTVYVKVRGTAWRDATSRVERSGFRRHLSWLRPVRFPAGSAVRCPVAPVIASEPSVNADRMTCWYGRQLSAKAIVGCSGIDEGVMNVRRVGRIGLLVGIALFLVGAGSVSARSATDTRGPKVVLIVGPAGAATPYYRQLADQAAAAAAKLTPNVVRVYSPDATWEHVKAALQGASVVVYLGHGNGWPSIYRNSLYPPTQDGFGLNPHEGAADAHQYFGEDKIGSEIKLAPNAVVIFSHLCYASGNTEPGLAEGTLAQAQQRVDNYAAGFFRAGAAAVIADAYLSPTYYVTSVLSKRSTVDSIWRRAPNVNDHFLTFASARTKGAIAEMDPDQVSSGFHRSLVVRPGVNTIQVRGSAPIRPVVVDPQVEPSLAPLGVTIGSPDLTTPPTAGSASRLILPIAKDAMGLLPHEADGRDSLGPARCAGRRRADAGRWLDHAAGGHDGTGRRLRHGSGDHRDDHDHAAGPRHAGGRR